VWFRDRTVCPDTYACHCEDLRISLLPQNLLAPLGV